MFIATVIFWLGRKHYVLVPPAPPNPHSFLNVCRTALASGTRGRVLAIMGAAAAIVSFLLIPKFGFVIAACLALVAVIAFGGLGVWLQLEAARGKHPDEAIEGVRAVLARAGALRARDAVLVALRPEGIDLGACRRTR